MFVANLFIRAISQISYLSVLVDFRNQKWKFVVIGAILFMVIIILAIVNLGYWIIDPMEAKVRVPNYPMADYFRQFANFDFIGPCFRTWVMCSIAHLSVMVTQKC